MTGQEDADTGHVPSLPGRMPRCREQLRLDELVACSSVQVVAV
ncbi:hypothetical protein [Lentzea sp. NPDC060358]